MFELAVMPGLSRAGCWVTGGGLPTVMMLVTFSVALKHTYVSDRSKDLVY